MCVQHLLCTSWRDRRSSCHVIIDLTFHLIWPNLTHRLWRLWPFDLALCLEVDVAFRWCSIVFCYMSLCYVNSSWQINTHHGSGEVIGLRRMYRQNSKIWPPPPATPKSLNDRHQNVHGWLRRDRYQHAKFRTDRISGFVSVHAWFRALLGQRWLGYFWVLENIYRRDRCIDYVPFGRPKTVF